MQKYIGTKIIEAEPAIKKGGKVYLLSEPIPKTMDLIEEGYKVVYENGYESWSPKEVFEDAYKPIEGLSFGIAIELLKKGRKVARKGWNGKGIFIELQRPDANSKMSHPYIFIDTTGLLTDNPDAPKNRVPWLASQTDMLSNDWIIVE